MKKQWVVSAFAFLAVFVFASVAMAADKAAAASGGWQWAAMLAAGLGIGIAAFGGALGQGRIGAAALEGIARNPSAQQKIFNPMIIALALIESLVIFTFLICIFLVLKA